MDEQARKMMEMMVSLSPQKGDMTKLPFYGKESTATELLADDKVRARLAKYLVVLCFRNHLEDLHAEGKISGEAMKELMIEAVNYVYSMLCTLNSGQTCAAVKHLFHCGDPYAEWNEPEEVEAMFAWPVAVRVDKGLKLEEEQRP